MTLSLRSSALIPALLLCCFLAAHAPVPPPPPANDDCANALNIPIADNGFAYGTFTSAVSDLTMATEQTGEFFQFSTPPGVHKKSVWYEFTISASRSVTVQMAIAPGSTVTNDYDAGFTVYFPAPCLPGNVSKINASTPSGTVYNPCFRPGTYRVQVSAVANLNASIFVKITLGCPADPDNSKYDCPANAYLFNNGNPLPQGSEYSDAHSIGCQSLDASTESACLPVGNPLDYLQSTWYVFKTGSRVDLLSIRFNVSPSGEKVGYRLFQGDVRPDGPALLTQLGCGMAKEDFTTRFIEFPCLLQPNTTYSVALFFHKNFSNNGNPLTVTLRQRGTGPTGWPKPVLPPVRAINQLGTLPGGGANGTPTIWRDSLNCSAFISKNICPPANPASGSVVVGTGTSAKTYDLATWATFRLASDANVEFSYSGFQTFSALHTRVFKKTPTGACPSPDPATAELVYEFPGNSGYVPCLLEGDYSVQVLSSSVYPLTTTSGYWDAWGFANLGTDFRLTFTVKSLTDPGLFRLDASGNFNAVNNLNALQDNVLYPSAPAVFVCTNTVLPDNSQCAGMTKAMYREVRIGDADGNGTLDSGLVCMSGLRTDYWADPPHVYFFGQGDANQLATAAGTHVFGQKIPGLTDWAGFCIDDDDYTSPPGIDNFCACVTPGIYTLASLGDVDNVGRGDAPGFKFNLYKTLHDSRAKAEVIVIGAATGTYTSSPDVFSCQDNLVSMSGCSDRRKLIFREFFLPETAVVSITDVGTASSTFTLFQGRASDLTATLSIIAGCANNVPLPNVVNDCAPLSGGQWYTLVSYGSGPNYTDKRVWNNLGSPSDVGKTSIIRISIKKPDVPNFNRPDKAHIAGITDWVAAPPANPNATTGKVYSFLTDTFCAPDTPFISKNLATCAAGYNRVSFYVFEITKHSFVQIRDVDQSFYTEVFPFDVKAQPVSLLTTQPVYQCLSKQKDYRQICDLPPGKYTIAIFANDSHKGLTVSPSIYVDAVPLSRFDHALNAYDYGHIPKTNAFVNGKGNDQHPSIPGQHPSRDVFTCITGATATDPTHTRCGTQLNPLIYAQPMGIPKPQFLQNNPPDPLSQPWRNIWYTFVLSGSGECTVQVNRLGGNSSYYPLMTVYESDANGNIPWATLRNTLGGVDSTLASGLKWVATNMYGTCDGWHDLDFTKNGCLRDSVRYYVVMSFDADEPNFPNQTISLSIKYNAQPTFPALYDERATANVVNGLGQTAPPYAAAPLTPGSTFVSPDFSLLCYTKSATDPVSTSQSCFGTGKSAWFKFEVAADGQFYAALENMATANNWVTNKRDLSIWRETTPSGPLTELSSLTETYISGQHYWQEGCISPGTYYLLVRHCSLIDTLPPYRVVLKLTDSPGDFCTNAVPLNVVNTMPVTGTATVDCHTIGTDIGEQAPTGNSCFDIKDRKTTWFKATVNAGPKMDLKFQLSENFTGNTGLNELDYRILAGSCGAMTPIACSALGSNVITLNCLGPGDYYVQVSEPVNSTGTSTALEGTLSLIVTATPSNTQTCTDPFDPKKVKADFTQTSDCQTITFINLSTAGSDIAYQWQFPGGSTSALANPTWTPPGSGTYSVTLTVTNTALNQSSTVIYSVALSNPFATYQPLPDGVICNGTGSVTLDATVSGATYLWDNGSTAPTRSVSAAGSFWVKITKDNCEKRDTATFTAVTAQRDIKAKLCPGGSITVGGQVFDKNKPSGTVTIPKTHPNDCDSLLKVSLSFYPSPATTTLAATICFGENYTFGNKTLTQSGTYADTLRNPAGCDSLYRSLSLSVTSRQNLQTSASGCASAPLLLASQITGTNYRWDDGSITQVRSVSATGTYTVSVSDATGCVIGEETFTATILSTFSSGFAANICSGDTYIFGGTPRSAAGAYTHTFKAANGCDSTVTLQLTVTPRQTFAQTASGCTGATLALAPGGSGGSAYLWHDGSTAPTFTATQGGLFWVKTLDPAGCTVRTDSFAVTFGTLAPPAVVATIPCTGSTATLIASGSSGEYRWFSIPTGGTALDTGAVFVTGPLMAPATYYVEAFQAAVPGCQSQRTAVQVQAFPTFDLNTSQTICNGDTLRFGSQTLTESGNYTEGFKTQHLCDSTVYLNLTVLPPVFQSSAVELCFGKTYTLPDDTKADTSGLYTGTYPDPVTGCPVMWQVALTIAPPVLYGSDTATICAGQTYPLPGGIQADTSGIYTGLFFDAPIGCIGQWQVVLTVLPPLTLVALPTPPLCAGSNDGQITAQSAGGSASFQFSLNTGPFQASPIFQNLAADNYTLTVRDANGCTTSVLATLTNPDALVFSVKKADPNCSGSADGSLEAQALGGTGLLEFSLNGGVFQQNPTFSNLAAGEYALTVRDANGCTTSASATLTNPDALVFSVKKADPNCSGSADGSLEAQALGGTGLLEFSLNGGVFQQNPTFSNLAAGEYALTVRDANGCATSVLATLTNPDTLVFSIKKADPNCSGYADGSLEAEASGGTGLLEYSLSGGVFQQNPMFAGLVAGTYTLTARDAQGCTATASATLNAPPALSFSVKKDGPNCSGSADGSLEAEALGGTGLLEYSLSGGVFQQNPVFAGLVAGSYALTVRDAQGCTASASAVLTDPLPIGLTATLSNPTCFGSADGSIAAKTLGGTALLTFRLNAGPPQPNPLFENLAAGSFQLVAVDGHGCRDSVQTTLSEPPKLALALDVTSPLCPSENPLGSVLATASGGQPPVLYALGSAAFSSVSEFENLSPALYTVTAQDAAGCEASAGIEVEAPLDLPLTLPPVLTLHWGDSVLLLPQIGFVTDSLVWSPSEGLSCTGCPHPWAKPSLTTTYKLMAWSAQGCSTTALVRVEVRREVRIYVPNVFRPDGGGLNDELLVFGGPEVHSVRSFSVYDRWGNALWQATDFPVNSLVGWDGRARGQQVSPGVYVWVCEVELNDGTRELLAGDVTVVR